MKINSDLFLMAVVLGTLLLFSFSVSFNSANKTKEEEINSFNFPDSIFRSGDLVFRDGRGVISSSFKRLSLTDPKYSHAGILHIEDGRYFVFHVIGGEDNKNNLMRKDLLSVFCSKSEVNSFAVYRSDQDANKIDSLAKYYFDNKLEFDSKFDLSTDDRMYCTELLYKILTKVSANNNYLPLSTWRGIKYSACDNIYLSPQVKKLFSFEYSR